MLERSVLYFKVELKSAVILSEIWTDHCSFWMSKAWVYFSKRKCSLSKQNKVLLTFISPVEIDITLPCKCFALFVFCVKIQMSKKKSLQWTQSLHCDCTPPTYENMWEKSSLNSDVTWCYSITFAKCFHEQLLDVFYFVFSTTGSKFVFLLKCHV